jgi:hypothetical protein
MVLAIPLPPDERAAAAKQMSRLKPKGPRRAWPGEVVRGHHPGMQKVSK